MVFGFYDKIKNRPKIRREPRLKILDRDAMGNLTDAISHKDEGEQPAAEPQKEATTPDVVIPQPEPSPSTESAVEQKPEPICVGDSCNLPTTPKKSSPKKALPPPSPKHTEPDTTTKSATSRKEQKPPVVQELSYGEIMEKVPEESRPRVGHAMKDWIENYQKSVSP